MLYSAKIATATSAPRSKLPVKVVKLYIVQVFKKNLNVQ